MKKFNLFIITLGAVAISMSACNKDWLNPAPANEQRGSDSLYGDNNNAAKFVTSCYTNLLTWQQSSFAWIGVTSITSDDADKGSSAGDNGSDKDQLDAITYTPTSGSFGDIWTSNYLGISNCNHTLEELPKFTTLDEATANRYRGEVRFLRAFYYFNLIRTFGHIPLIDSVIANADAATSEKANKQLGADTIYPFIEADLNYAISILPTKQELGASNVGRASKGAATGLLAKVSLYEKKYQQAYDLSNQLITGAVGTYGLAPDYTKIWREVGENSEESVFEIQSSAGNPDAAIQQYSVVQGMREPVFVDSTRQAYSGWGFNTPSEDLDNAYEAGDVRKNATIIHVGDTLFDGVILKSATNPRYNYKAYVSRFTETYSGNADLTNKNIRVLRMGEIYLIRAEAANELNNIGEAQNSLNAVRHRAGLGDTPAGDQATLRTAIWNERRVELGMEHDRFYDLVRQGRAGTVLRALGKSFVDGKNEIFPIPQTQIDASGGLLQQNPGY